MSELRWLEEYRTWDDTPYIALGWQYGLPVYASSNCLPVQAPGWSGEVNPRRQSTGAGTPRFGQSQRGAHGIALYQSDTGIQ